jgi:hypothetical protein
MSEGDEVREASKGRTARVLGIAYNALDLSLGLCRFAAVATRFSVLDLENLETLAMRVERCLEVLFRCESVL